jgi:DNA-binding transcriptional LysR family regulator
LPTALADLARHRLITYGESTHPPFPDVNWLIKTVGAEGVTPQNVMTINNFYGIARAVQSGLGIAALPEFIANEDVSLIRVLPEVDAPKVPAYFLYPEELRHSKRIAVLRDFLLEQVAKQEF